MLDSIRTSLTAQAVLVCVLAELALFAIMWFIFLPEMIRLKMIF